MTSGVERFLEIRGQEAHLVERNVIKQLATDDLVEGIMKLARKESAILPFGCVYHIINPERDLEGFVLAKPMGDYHLSYQARRTSPENIQKAVKKLLKIEEKDLSVDSHNYTNIIMTVMMPYHYFLIKRVISSGAIAGIHPFITFEPLGEKSDIIYSSPLPNYHPKIGEFCFGTTTRVEPSPHISTVMKFFSNFMQSPYNDDLGIHVSSNVIKRGKELGEDFPNVCEQDRMMIAWVLESRENGEALLKPSNYSKIGKFEDHVPVIIAKSSGDGND